MENLGLIVQYSMVVFVIVVISGCIINLLKQHFIIQLAGIAFFLTYSVFRSYGLILRDPDISFVQAYSFFLPVFSGISACLISMVAGFWIFPPVRRKFKN